MSEELNMNTEEMIDEEELIVLLDENDNEMKFRLIMTFDGQEKTYVAMEPAEEIADFEEGEVLIMQIVDGDDGEATLEPIETEEELEAAWELFEARYEELCDGNCDECEEEDCEDRE